jgi:glycosyltransferase involved in cell wall biosynthesis
LVLALDWLNRRILKRADSIIALDRFMVERMEAKLTRPEAELRRPITIIPPWPMDDYLEAVPHSENQFRKEQRWEDKFVVMYSGNHSLVHPLDTILDAAEALRDDPRFLFAFIGGGKGKQAVEDRVAELNIESCSLNEGSATTNNKQQTTSNLISLPYQPLDQIRYSLSAADLHIVSLGNNMSGIVHPCKIYGALSIGRPVLTLGPKVSYLSDMIESRGLRSEIGETARIGWSIEHGDVDAAVAALKEAADQTQQARTTIGQSAEEVARERFSREQLVAQFLDIVLR